MGKQVLAWRCLMNAERSVSSILKTFRQFVAYALIGICTNAVGYAIYLFATHVWGAPKITMTVLYIVGAYSGFIANRRFTFQHDGSMGVAGGRYIVMQLIGYVINFSILLVFVDMLKFPHQIVQAVAIGVVAIFLFIVLRLYVFVLDTAVTKVVN
jgi:putative flippase GtrA